jgi:hypothetical protein
MLEPVIGNLDKSKPTQSYDPKKKTSLTSKQEIPHYFLDMLLQPNNFMNA